MNHIKLLLLLCTLAIFQSSFAQTTLLQESFESNGEGSRYTSNAGDSGINDFWGRTNLNPAPYHSDVIGLGTRDGSSYWAGEATSDVEFNGAAGGRLTFNSVNVSGYSALEVKIAVGISKAGQDRWEKERQFVLEYKMDSDPWTIFGLMTGDNPGNLVPGRLKIDTDNNPGTFGPFGTEMTGTFTDYTFPIGVTGNNVQLRIRCITLGSEEIGFDNIRLVGTLSSNVAPVLANIEGSAISYDEGDPAKQISNTITVSDNDDVNLESARVQITNNFDASEDVLTFTSTGGITGVYVNSTGVLQLSGTSSLANYQTVLRSVKYQNTDPIDASDATRRIQFQVNDGLDNSNIVTRDININTSLNTTPAALPYCESFETDGEGTRYGSDNFSSSDCDFANRGPAGTNVGGCFEEVITGADGSFVFNTEDVNFNGGFTLTSQPLDISSLGSASFTIEVLLAVSRDDEVRWENTDKFQVEYSIDGGSYQTVGLFRGNNANPILGSDLYQDNDNDFSTFGPFSSTAVSDVFTNYAFNFLGSGNTLSFRITIASTGTEELAFDNICVSAVSCPSITFNTTETDESCPNRNDGAILITNVAGGTPPYVYSSDGGSTYQSFPNLVQFLNLPDGTYDVRVKDDNGCESAIQSVTIDPGVDNTNPTASCPADITVDNTAGQCGAVVTYTIGATDACQLAAVPTTASPASGSFFDIGTTTVTGNAFDAAGNTDDCTFTVTVNPASTPEISVDDAGNTDFGSVTLGNSASKTYTITNLGSTSLNINSVSNSDPQFVIESISNAAVDPGGTSTIVIVFTPQTVGPQSSTINIASDDCDENPYTFNLSGTGTDCPDGFVFEPGSGQCIDIDECAAGPNACPPGTICINTNGGFLCEPCEVTAVCQNVTIQLNASGIATLTPENINNNSSTVCGDIQLAVDLTEFTCSNIGNNNTAELTVTNNGGGESTCTATVTVEDNIAPTITCPATQTEFVDASCEASLSNYTSLATAGDNCGAVSIVQSPPAGMSFTSDIEVTLTAQDGGLSKSCTFTVQPKDNTPPTASNPATINVSCLDDVPVPNPGVVTDESDNCSVAAVCTGEVWINEIHYDNTGGDTGEFVEIAGPAGTNLSGYSLAFHTGSNGSVYSTVSLSGVIDDEGNGIGALAFFEAEIQNGTPDGVALIKNGTVIEFLSYEGSFTATNGDASGTTSTDIGVQESSSTAVGESLQLKGSGNQSSDFTWTAPSTDSPGDLNDGQTITPCSAPSGCTSEVWINEIHYDDFSTDEGEFVEVAGPAGTNLSSYKLLLYNGNGGNVYTTVNLSGVIDDEGDGIGAVAFFQSGIQNGSPDGVALTKNGAVIEFLSYEGSLTATNGAASGTSSTDIGVQEGSSTAAGESLQLKGSGNQSSDFTWTAPSTDSPGSLNDGQTITSCGGSSPGVITVSFLSEINNGGLGSLDDPLVITRTYQVQDAAGNTTPVLRTINVFDDVSPTAVCPANIPDVELDVNGNGSLSANIGDGSSTDNCSATETSPSLNFTCSDVGQQTVLLTATDPAGNQNSISCSFTVVDNFNACCTPGIATSISGSPGPLCPSSLQTLSVNGSLNDDQSWVWYTGSCGGTQVATGANFNVSPTTTTTYYVRAEGTCSGTNGACASLTITIEDGVNPVASCPADINVNNDPGQCSAVVSFAATGSDNCGGPVAISYSQNPGTVFNVGTTTVDVTAKDESGNTDNCSFDVVVADSEGPTVLCKSTAVSLGGDGTYTLTDAFIFNNIVASITDNCGTTDQVSASKTEFTCDDLGDIEVQLTFTDINGKTSSCFPKLGVTDPLSACNQPPTAVCQNLTVQTATGTCEATITADQINNGSSDPDDDALTLSLDNTGPFSAGGPYSVELTVSDGSLSDKCTATVVVEDKEAPKFTGCPDPINLFNDEGDCGAIATWTAPVLEDNCPEPTSSATHIPGAFFPVGTTTVTYSGSDKAGNPAVDCSFTVSVTDTEKPKIACPGDISTGTDPGVCGAQITFTTAIASDNCEVDAVKARYRPVDENGSAIGNWTSRVADPSGFFPVGRYQVQWRAEDIYGNKKTCSHYVNVYDDEDPVAVCKNLTIDFNGEQDISLSVSQVWDEAASSDNCGYVEFVSASLTISCEELGNTVAIPVTIQDEAGNEDDCTAYVDVIGLPCGWSEGPDDGSLNCDGQTTSDYDVDDESFTLTSDGCWHDCREADKATYVYHPLCGDGTLTAKLASINTSGYAGLMARESLDPLARRAGVLKNFSTRRVRREWRSSYGGIVSQSNSNRSRVKWLRIVRQGNQIKSYTSTNGSYWRLLYRVTYSNLEDCIYVGMMAYSLNGSAEVKAVFENVTLSGSGTLAGGVAGDPTSITPEGLHAWGTAGNIGNGTIDIFPNPASSQAQLVLEDFQDKPAQLIVRDAFGKLVRQIDLDSAMGVVIPLKVQNLAPGVYIISLIQDQQLMGSKRLVVQP